MSTHSGDDGHPCSCVLLPIGLAAVNNVIIYDEFSNSHDGFHSIFTFCLFCRLTPCLEAGACAADSVNIPDCAFRCGINGYRHQHEIINMLIINMNACFERIHIHSTQFIKCMLMHACSVISRYRFIQHAFNDST